MKNCQGKVIQNTNGKQGKEHIDLILTKKVRKKTRFRNLSIKRIFGKTTGQGSNPPRRRHRCFPGEFAYFFRTYFYRTPSDICVSLDLAHVILSLYLISSSAKIIQKNCSENIFPKFTQRSIFLVNLQTYNFI